MDVSEIDVSILYKIIDDIVQFINQYKDLANCHLVNFLTKNHFDHLLHGNIRDELLELTDDELCFLPSGQLDMTRWLNLSQFVETARRLSLPSVLNETNFIINPETLCNRTKFKFDHYMGVKKSHEVEEMACAVASCAKQRDITCAVDIGSGRGYLSSLLATYFGLKVLGFDACDGNTHSANIRHTNVKKHWKGILKRSSSPSDGSCETGVKPVDNAYYIPVTYLINHRTDLTEVLQSYSCSKDVLICGLHTCGDLASNTINMFLRCPQAKVMCIVGCCYHLIEERFDVNPFRKPGSCLSGDPDPESYGFPLSSYLTKNQFGLGRNARTMAAQPVNRMADQMMVPNKSLFWRALLQQIIWDKYKNIDVLEYNVGPIAKKCATFSDYVRKAVDKTKIPIEISEHEISEYEDKFKSHEKKMNAFFQFRCTLAPVLETIIVLDRLCYLLEQDNIAEAHVVQLFNPVTSPRCFALVASKR